MKLLAMFLLVMIARHSWASTHVVQMKSISYDPKVLEVKVGDEVEFKNVSYTEHSATSETNFETGLIEPKKTSKKIKFEKPGTFSFHCSVHGKTMSGTITVKP